MLSKLVPNPHLKMANMMSVALTKPIKTKEATLLMEAATVLAVSSMDGMGLGVGVGGVGEQKKETPGVYFAVFCGARFLIVAPAERRHTC